jgi:hypothetical protein
MAEKISGEFYIKLGKEILDRAERTYGAIHKSTPITMNGEKGFLIFRKINIFLLQSPHM